MTVQNNAALPLEDSRSPFYRTTKPSLAAESMDPPILIISLLQVNLKTKVRKFTIILFCVFEITGRPRFTRKPDIVQYLFLNSTDVVSFSCPLNGPGQLFGMPSNFTPYEYFWRLRIPEGTPTLQSNDTFELSNNNRELQVHLPTPRPLDQYRFECHANVRRCTQRINSCGAISTTDTTLYPSPSGFQVKIVGKCQIPV